MDAPAGESKRELQTASEAADSLQRQLEAEKASAAAAAAAAAAAEAARVKHEQEVARLWAATEMAAFEEKKAQEQRDELRKRVEELKLKLQAAEAFEPQLAEAMARAGRAEAAAAHALQRAHLADVALAEVRDPAHPPVPCLWSAL
jgi:chromosome segregation ATPase